MYYGAGCTLASCLNFGIHLIDPHVVSLHHDTVQSSDGGDGMVDGPDYELDRERLALTKR
jgi:hypothetical protein